MLNHGSLSRLTCERIHVCLFRKNFSLPSLAHPMFASVRNRNQLFNSINAKASICSRFKWTSEFERVSRLLTAKNSWRRIVLTGVKTKYRFRSNQNVLLLVFCRIEKVFNAKNTRFLAVIDDVLVDSTVWFIYQSRFLRRENPFRWKIDAILDI